MHRSGLVLLAAIAPLLLLACGKVEPVQSDPPPAMAPAAAAAVAHAPLRLGEPITAPAVTLADVAARPGAFTGKPFTTTGVVTAVCQEAGCWMEMKDDKGEAHIRMHGHAFYVPKTSPGHHARVQALLVPTKNADTAECDQEAANQMGHPVAKVELDATGVELVD
jgi:hypothetical protein